MPANLGVVLFAVFILQILLLYLFSKQLIAGLQFLFYRVSGDERHIDKFLSLVFLPGTLLHESAHALTAVLLLVKVHSFSLFPHADGDAIKLGSVEITKVDFIRRAFIGVAPVIWGVGVLLGLAWLLESVIPREISFWWMYLIIGYSFFVISNTMFSSKKDMEGVVVFGILLITILLTLILFQIYWPFLLFGEWLNRNSGFLERLNSYLLVPILIDLLVLGLFKLFRVR